MATFVVTARESQNVIYSLPWHRDGNYRALEPGVLHAPERTL